MYALLVAGGAGAMLLLFGALLVALPRLTLPVLSGVLVGAGVVSVLKAAVLTLLGAINVFGV
ncbi:MAG: hypothetical protein KDA28_07310, partial [Phycisphaerales bacterium]|nr:hypothetical protein [Phycisphaerales bacterium]